MDLQGSVHFPDRDDGTRLLRFYDLYSCCAYSQVNLMQRWKLAHHSVLMFTIWGGGVVSIHMNKKELLFNRMKTSAYKWKICIHIGIWLVGGKSHQSIAQPNSVSILSPS